jgi:ABC-2 type transport system permease protein
LSWILATIWYGLYTGAGIALALLLPEASLEQLKTIVPVGLLGVMCFWQILPIATMSSGWSLQLSKLQVYPIKTSALFTIEIILRLTTAPEMILVMLGATVGLLRHPHIPAAAALLLLLYIPMNLFLSLALREVLLRSVRNKRFRELRGILVIAFAVTPQLLLRTQLGPALKPYFMKAAFGSGTPWYELGVLSLGSFSPVAIGLTFVWILLFYWFAQRQFAHSLLMEEGPIGTAPAKASRSGRRSVVDGLLDLPNRLARDPMAALLQKEFRSLLRMPRFRVIFGMSCIFSVLVFIPMILRGSEVGFINNNFLPMVSMYGLLILGEVLLFNVFGFDRNAGQVYFVTPVPLDAVLKAKNLVAAVFILLQNLSVVLVAAILRVHISPVTVAESIAVTAVVAIFLMGIGNLTSVTMARPVDPNQTFRKQTGGKMQIWLLLGFLGLGVPIGLAFLARWAMRSDWAFFGVLAIDFSIGVIVYRMATESALQRVTRNCERIVDALSKGSDPIGLGT